MDTGAGQSMVTKSEAKWLGLKLLHSSVDATDVWSGKTAKTSEIGVARRLAIGRAELRNVLFVIVPDDNALVQDQPAGKRGIIGLPVLFALETVRWDAAGNFETGTRLPPPEARTRVLCLVGDNVAVEVQCEGKRIVLVLDTGIGFTVLGSRFHDEFRALVDASANKSTRQMIGSFGDTDRASVTLPLKFDVGGFESALSEVPVLLDDRAGGGHGTIGLDLLKQAQVVTIDFRSMSLTLEGHTATVASH
jgi:predicted aspartyl protease